MKQVPAAVTELIEWRRKQKDEIAAGEQEQCRAQSDEFFAAFESSQNTVWDALKPYSVREVYRIKVNAPGLYPFEITLQCNSSLWSCEKIMDDVSIRYAFNNSVNKQAATQALADFMAELASLYQADSEAPSEPDEVPTDEIPFEQYHLGVTLTENEMKDWLNRERAKSYFLHSLQTYSGDGTVCFLAVTEAQF